MRVKIRVKIRVRIRVKIRVRIRVRIRNFEISTLIMLAHGALGPQKVRTARAVWPVHEKHPNTFTKKIEFRIFFSFFISFLKFNKSGFKKFLCTF